MSDKVTVESLARGASGFVDAHFVREGETNRDSMELPDEDMILGRKPMPVYNPNSGRHFVSLRALVFDSPSEFVRCPITKSKGGHLTIDFTSDPSIKLNSPLALINGSAIMNENYTPCEIEGLAEALKCGPPESAASLKAEADARLAAEAKGKKPVAV